MAGYLTEIAALFEAADSKYIKEPATQGLRSVVALAESTVSYFWFLFNEAPAYDRFRWCASHATREELAEWGNYRRAPSGRITFDQRILSNLESGLGGWGNAGAGIYDPPIR